MIEKCKKCGRLVNSMGFHSCIICGESICYKCCFLIMEVKDATDPIYSKYQRKTYGQICKHHLKEMEER